MDLWQNTSKTRANQRIKNQTQVCLKLSLVTGRWLYKHNQRVENPLGQKDLAKLVLKQLIYYDREPKNVNEKNEWKGEREWNELRGEGSTLFLLCVLMLIITQRKKFKLRGTTLWVLLVDSIPAERGESTVVTMCLLSSYPPHKQASYIWALITTPLHIYIHFTIIGCFLIICKQTIYKNIDCVGKERRGLCSILQLSYLIVSILPREERNLAAENDTFALFMIFRW